MAAKESIMAVCQLQHVNDRKRKVFCLISRRYTGEVIVQTILVKWINWVFQGPVNGVWINRSRDHGLKRLKSCQTRTISNYKRYVYFCFLHSDILTYQIEPIYRMYYAQLYHCIGNGNNTNLHLICDFRSHNFACFSADCVYYERRSHGAVVTSACLEIRRSRVRTRFGIQVSKKQSVSSLLTRNDSTVFNSVGYFQDWEVASSARVWISNLVSGEQCHLIHLTIFRRFS